MYKPVFERFRQLLIEIGPNHNVTTIKCTIGIMHLLGIAIPLSPPPPNTVTDETQARMLSVARRSNSSFVFIF